MNVCGIIAEYNPFHKGHLYHIQKAAELSSADYTIAVMSGNFMQRGIPALADKFVRTEMALRCGADLVLELPSCYATASAEYFSAGAVSLLDKLGVVTHLCFGSECGNAALLRKLAQILVEEPAGFQESLRRKLKAGLSFPVARTDALSEVYPQFKDSLSVLSSPNNILGIEYMKALWKRNSKIQPLTITRSGAGYHDKALTTPFCSATAIRQAIETGMPFEELSTLLPKETYSILEKYFANRCPIYTDDFSALLHYKLLLEQNIGYTSYLDVSEDLSDRIKKNLYCFTTFSQFCDLLKTKEITYTRITRCLLHILLDIRKVDIDLYVKELDYTPYARILGFRKNASPLLSAIGKNIQIPLVSKMADADKILDKPALEMLRRDITVSDIYNSVRADKIGSAMQNEYSTPIVIV